MKEMTNNPELTHSMIHYLFAIHKLKEQKGFARVTDIAKELNITKGSVSSALHNLKKKNLIKEEDNCKFLNLTEEGHAEVHKVLSTRTLFYHFLKEILGVADETAYNDTCVIEHLMSEESRNKLFNFMKIIGCSCGNQEKEPLLKTELSIDLCRFDEVTDFLEWQKKDDKVVDISKWPPTK